MSDGGRLWARNRGTLQGITDAVEFCGDESFESEIEIGADGAAFWVVGFCEDTFLGFGAETQLKPSTNPLCRLISPKRYLTIVTARRQIISCWTEINRPNTKFMSLQCALQGGIAQVPDTDSVGI